MLTFEGRVTIGDLVVREFDHTLPQVLETLFTPDMERPAGEGLRLFETPAWVIGDRLDLMGHGIAPALGRLTASLELARVAYAGDGPAPLVAEPWHALVGMDAQGWLRRLAAEDGPAGIYGPWLLALVDDHEIETVLRLCTLARPEATVRLTLQADAHFVSEPFRHQLVLTQTAADAEALAVGMAASFPHLADLVLVSHLGGDGSPAALLAQAQGLDRFRLHQPLTAVFRREGAAEAARLQADPERTRALVCAGDLLADPAATLERVLGVSRRPAPPAPQPDAAADA